MKIELASFSKPTVFQYATLLNSSSVQRHMPLSEAQYSDEWISHWIQNKYKTWDDPEKGPWSVWLDGLFAGWAGVEPSGDELSFGIVLLKSFWGQGEKVIESTFEKIRTEFPKATSVLVELPVSRKSEIFASRLALHKLQTVWLSGHKFHVYRKFL